MDRNLRHITGLEGQNILLQQAIRDHIRYMIDDAQRPFGVPTEDFAAGDVLARFGRITRVDGNQETRVYLPPAEPGVIGKVVCIKNNTDGAEPVQIVPHGEDTIDDYTTLSSSSKRGSMILAVAEPGNWITVASDDGGYFYSGKRYQCHKTISISSNNNTSWASYRNDFFALDTPQPVTAFRLIYQVKVSGVYSPAGDFRATVGSLPTQSYTGFTNTSYQTHTMDFTQGSYARPSFIEVDFELKINNSGNTVYLGYTELHACIG